MTIATPILDNLNESQALAVTTEAPLVLTLAGAGAGKTRVLTHRAAHLITERQRSPFDLLIVTFTNKAAAEMKERIINLVGDRPAQKMKIGTFHSIGCWIIRQWAQRAGLYKDITIYDETDRHDIIEWIIEEKEGKKKSHASTVREVMDALNVLEAGKDEYISEDVLDLVSAYKAYLKDENALDFHTMLTTARDLLRKHADIQEYYHKRFKHVLIDEYQDTNPIQQEIIDLIKPDNLFAVCDDYQSIYKFRGADMLIMLNFAKRKDVEVIKLVENYRSRPAIVEAANNLIIHNTEQLHKTLVPMREHLNKSLLLVIADSAYKEAEIIAEDISLTFEDRDFDSHKIAILARTHRHLDIIAYGLMKRGIPFHRIARKDIWTTEPARIITAFLRIIRNPNDNWSMAYILHRLRCLEDLEWLEIKKSRLENSLTTWEAYQQSVFGIGADPIAMFVDDQHQVKKEYTKASHIVNHLLGVVPLEAMYREKHLKTKVGQFQEVLEALEKWETNNPNENKYIDFLDWLAARQIQDQVEDHEITLGTVHAAKGLEWDVVYLTQMHDGGFPYSKVETEEGGSLEAYEEERRICYVGITRAKDYLIVSCPYTDAFDRPVIPSPYLKEMKVL